VPHYLYLVRHGEQQDAEHGLDDGPLSSRGKRQAQLIAERLGGVPFTGAYHSPLNRAAETAAIMTERMPALKPEPSSLLFDCIPSGPTPDMPKAFESFFGAVTEAEVEAGRAQMEDAVSEFLTPARGDRHDRPSSSCTTISATCRSSCVPACRRFSRSEFVAAGLL
jgi:probable phosphoglycerate mutase